MRAFELGLAEPLVAVALDDLVKGSLGRAVGVVHIWVQKIPRLLVADAGFCIFSTMAFPMV